MPKPLSFKGDPKPKKRKRPAAAAATDAPGSAPPDEALHAIDPDSWLRAACAAEADGPTMLVFASSSSPKDGDGGDCGGEKGDGGGDGGKGGEAETVRALAADALGRVFAARVDSADHGRAESAEPDDVRQVWVVGRAGEGDVLGLRSAGGRYLGVVFRDEDEQADGDGVVRGVLGALSEARGGGEGWCLVDGRGGDVHLCTRDGRAYVGLVPAGAGARDAAPGVGLYDSPVEATRLVVKMQARFKRKVTAAKAERAYEKITRAEVEKDAGRKLTDDEVRRLKRARREGTYREDMLDVRSKGHHDKYA